MEDKDTYLTRPDLGRVLSEASLQTVQERYKPVPQVLIVLSDGLSTDAVLANADEIVPPLTNGLRQAGFTVGDPLFLRYGRVKAEDRLGEAIGCDVVLMLVGERPGLGQSESMSCYGVYCPTAAQGQRHSAEQGAQSRFFRLTTCRKSAGERREQPFLRRF